MLLIACGLWLMVVGVAVCGCVVRCWASVGHLVSAHLAGLACAGSNVWGCLGCRLRRLAWCADLWRVCPGSGTNQQEAYAEIVRMACNDLVIHCLGVMI